LAQAEFQLAAVLPVVLTSWLLRRALKAIPAH